MSNERNPLAGVGIKNPRQVFHNLSPARLVEQAIRNGEGALLDNGAFAVRTGARTGRSPSDKYTVRSPSTADTVWWGKVNQPVDAETFDRIERRADSYLQGRDIYVVDGAAGADPAHRLNVRVITNFAWHALFARTLFLRPSAAELEKFEPDFTIVNAGRMKLDGKADGLPRDSEIFVALNFDKKRIVIAGTEYAGEMKKGIFTVMNYLLPQKGVLSMHCSANIGEAGDVALFFGLSGTGKTTLSADPARRLIGDDEHGWSDKGVFNIEGGCYAKTIKLSREAEPQIYNAIRFGSIIENVKFDAVTGHPDYDSDEITENGRCTYPVDFIDNCDKDGMGGHPTNIFFLAADAFGVLPPIARLDAGQAMYHYLSGYTAKLAGTEAGVTHPEATFSACFGQVFLPLHPTRYAKLLAEKMTKHKTRAWLVNTGWSGGGYGVGGRMKIGVTRGLLTAALTGALDRVSYTADPVFGFDVPDAVPGIPTEVLKPRNTWKSGAEYDAAAKDLAARFRANFEQFADQADEATKRGGPRG